MEALQSRSGRPSPADQDGFRPELRISSEPVIAAFAVLGMLFMLSAATSPVRLTHVLSVDLALACYGAFAACWLIHAWRPVLGKSMVLAAALFLVAFVCHRSGQAGVLAFMPVPVVLAVALVGARAGLVMTVATTLTCAGLARITGHVDPLSAGIVSAGTWSVFVALLGLLKPVRDIGGWAWNYYQDATARVEEARARQAELKAALQDLADANAQMIRLNILAQGLRQAAEDARLAKEQFVANVSHELRTPLNMIIGFSEMISQSSKAYGGPLPSGLLADLSVIHRNARHLSELIDDVLDLSQIEAGQMALTQEHVAFAEVAEAATEAVRPLFVSKGLDLRLVIQPDLPALFCDRTRIREVLLNLLSNAGRFTEHGGAELRAREENNNLLITITDTGPGIAADKLDRLFEPFHQIDGSIRRRYGGTGLGLSISKRFIEMHGGSITIESQEGSGTCFRICLPLPRETETPYTGGAAYISALQPGWEYLPRLQPSAAPKVKLRPRFVVLETGNALQRLLARYLYFAEILPVPTLEAAVQEMNHQACQALLINAASLPAALQEVRAAPLPDGIPALVCSVPDFPGAADMPGATEHLVKPVSQAALTAALDRLHLSGNTILVVDDEPDALHLFRRMLASLDRGYRVLRARDGREGLEMLREHRPNAVLLDLVMPGMDGFGFLETKSQDPEVAGIPVIVVSARDPSGQPVVSHALSVVHPGGLSAPRLLACIRVLSELLSAAVIRADPAPPTAPPD